MQPVQNGILVSKDVTNTILINVAKASLSNVPRVCKLWNELYQKLKEKLAECILPIGKSDIKVLFSQRVTQPLLEKFVQDPRALTKVYYFFQSYFTDIPDDQRLFSYDSEARAITHTGKLTCRRLFEHSETWRPYATALSILVNCNVNMQPLEQKVTYPCFTAVEPEEAESEGQLMVIDHNEVEEQALLVSNYLLPRFSLFYLTFDHEKHPTCFTELHRSIISGFDPMMRVFDERAILDTDNSTALKLIQTAITALGNRADISTVAIVAEKCSKIAEAQEAYKYYLQAAQFYEIANAKCVEEHTSWCQAQSDAPPVTGDYAVRDSKIGIYHDKAGIAYYKAARLAPTEEQQIYYSNAAMHFAINLSNNERESRESTASEYRYAASAHFYSGDYQKAKAYYIEAKKRKVDPAIDTRLNEIEKKLSET